MFECENAGVLLKKIPMEKVFMIKGMSKSYLEVAVVASYISSKIPGGMTLSVPLLLSIAVPMFVENLFSYEKLANFDEVKEFKQLYDKVLENFNNLKEDFGFNNNIELCTFINYCVYNDYLSYRKNYTFTNKYTTDINSISGANIMAGRGVCRHIASFYKDILTLNGVENCIMGVIVPDEISLKNVIKGTIDFDSLEFKKLIGTLVGNHAANMLLDGDLVYCLDPTQLRMYAPTDKKKIFVDTEGEEIKLVKSAFKKLSSDGLENYKKIIEFDSAQLTLFDEQKENVINICSDNKDMLEKFYKDNKELYDEIRHGIYKFTML